MGCAADAIANPNTLTLVDAGKLYEGVANGSLLDGAHREAFYAADGRQGLRFQRHLGSVSQIIDQEAPPAMTAAQKQAFRDRIRLSYKAGGYTSAWAAAATHARSTARSPASRRFPFCSSAKLLAPRQYVFGIFIDKADNAAAADTAFNTTKAELLREQVAEALATWSTCAFQQQLPMMQR